MSRSDENNQGDAGSNIKHTRRTLLHGVGLLGLVGLASQSASAASNGDKLTFGGNFEGSPKSDTALSIANTKMSGSNFQFGIDIEAHAKQARAIRGFVPTKKGSSIALLGRNKSRDGSGLEGFADAKRGQPRGVKGTSFAPGGRAVEGVNKAESGNAFGVVGQTDSDDGYGLYTPDDAQVEGTMEVGGDLEVSGTKHFVQSVATDSGQKKVTYTAVEAGNARTEATDVVEMTDGVAVVELPDHFGMVTSSSEPISVQVTPYADEKVHPQVTDQSTDRIIVKDFGDGPDEYTFSYTVKGIRKGFEEQEDDVINDS